MNKTVAKRPTLIVREVMRKYGKTMIWTNKHKTMRSVKCLQSNRPANKDRKMLDEILRALKKAKVTASYNLTFYGDHYGWGPRDSIIIQLPLKA